MTGGYEEDFIGIDLDDRYKCPICHHVLRDAVQTNCGHRFCQVCFNLSIVTLSCPLDSKKCPMDNTELTDVYGDNAFNREVLSLSVYCRAKKMGCNWEGELRNLQAHLDTCPIYPVPCGHTGCDKHFNQSELVGHRVSCPYRPSMCPFCDSKMSSMDIAKHLAIVCLRFPIICTRCLQVTLSRTEMIKHLADDGDCPMTQIKCPFSKLGCDEKRRRYRMKDHLVQGCAEHVMLLLKQHESNVIQPDPILPPFCHMFRNSNHIEPDVLYDLDPDFYPPTLTT